jgi:hypothetical protein
MIYANAGTWAAFTPDEQAAGIAAQNAFNNEFFGTGELLGAFGLADAAAAKVVRTADGLPAVTDGPYLEAKEHLASYYLLDVASEQRALAIAERMPFAAVGGVEVWPVTHEAWPPPAAG